MKNRLLVTYLIAFTFSLLSCQSPKALKKQEPSTSFYGTTLPFASESVYFLMTDRFVDGDPTNNQEQQGGQFPTFMQPLKSDNGETAYVGYMGGDFKGILNNAAYIRDMGFTSIWLTPIVDQPDEAFSGGEKIEFGGAFKDGGKTGYHGYWGVNFFQLDEHLPSKNLSFKQLTSQLREQYQIKTVLDVVANHGSPSFSMQPKQQPKYGKIFNQDGVLIADHQNLEPKDLNKNNPLHQMYSNKPDIMQLSDFDPDSPAVLNYFVDAYLHWIEQGANAFRIDTIKHMPHRFWKKFSQKIREKHPNFFMFAESYSFDANFIAEHTLEENGRVSVLDFPGREAMIKTFENKGSDFSELLPYLHLTNSPYQNAYELMTFYDNHDMSRMNADENGFIDAHNWLFTARGIPVIYYGSESAFMAGKKEHEGNRNYYGIDNIEKAKQGKIYSSLSKIAHLRKKSISLQKGLQINLEFKSTKAAFYRVYEHEGVNQTALVLLNKGDQSETFSIKRFLSEGDWVDGFNGQSLSIKANDKFETQVDAHQVKVFLLNHPNKNQLLRVEMIKRMSNISKN